jgi:hypothetical protein
MDNYPFDTTGLCSDDINTFQEAYDTLKSRFPLEFTGLIDFGIELFEVFKGYHTVNVRDSFVIKQGNNNDCYILFVETESRSLGKGKVSGGCEIQIWALAYLRHNFGRMLIRRETLADKIIELVHPVELDFAEDKAFSDTFYVLINDHEKAVRGIDRNFRNAVMDTRHDHFLIEIVEHSLIVGNHDPISPEKTTHMAEFITRICSHC